LIALTGKIDIILCDYNMPRMNGLEFLRTLNTNPDYGAYASVPVIGIGEPFSGEKKYFKEKFEKPLKLGEISDCVDKYCNESA